MCGIVGIVGSPDGGLQATVAAMNDTLVHRGPDDAGMAVLEEDGVALAMRRLSILDIEGGHQPMWDEAREHVIVFNGEIYNFAPLRAQLVARGHRFVTDHSDTEVLVHGFEEWGTELFARLNGMFALAVWSRRRRCLFVARDRAGEKPLYIAKVARGYAIGSELKAVVRHPGLDRTLDPLALEQYLAFDYVLGPRTMLEHVKKLPAGHYAEITAAGYEVRPYWKLQFHPSPAPTHELLERLDALLDESVRTRMVADVPVGLFLSGGLDSTTVGYYMRRHGKEVHSFSIGFEDPRFDESAYAQLAATHLGTEHHLEVFSQDKIKDLIPDIADVLDEPMADQSILPTYLLSGHARRTVKVALGGDGSDELLMGYRTYQALKVSWALDRLPLPVRRAIARTAAALPSRAGPLRLRGKQFGERLDTPPVHRLLACLGSYNGRARWVMSPELTAALPASVFDEVEPLLAGDLPDGIAAADATIAAYMRGYLQEDILVKVDRASMAVSLEVRAPFLDPELIDFLATVPASLKLRRMTGKYLLRTLMRGRIPDAIIDRRKQGFGVPVNSWLRSSLAPLLREYMAPSRLAAGGVFDPGVVTRLVDEHVDGRHDHGHQLWPLLLFELWRERWLEESTEVARCLASA
jgi:asparagine synthase (glutamine-hydrolysing)